MTNINIWRTIEDKGLGKLIGILKRDSGDYYIYEEKSYCPCGTYN